MNQEGGGSDRFAGQSNDALNRQIGDTQRVLLRRLFGRSVKGARASMERLVIPDGLTDETLQIYAELARRAIVAGKDTLGVQAMRLQVIEAILKARQS